MPTRSPKPLNPVGICYCGRRHDNIGYAPSTRHPLKWFCWNCYTKGKALYRMKTVELDAYEQNAIWAGGEAAGGYLDLIGQTDLAQLSEKQFTEFFSRFLENYAHTMRTCFEGLKDTF